MRKVNKHSIPVKIFDAWEGAFISGPFSCILAKLLACFLVDSHSCRSQGVRPDNGHNKSVASMRELQKESSATMNLKGDIDSHKLFLDLF